MDLDAFVDVASLRAAEKDLLSRCSCTDILQGDQDDDDHIGAVSLLDAVLSAAQGPVAELNIAALQALQRVFTRLLATQFSDEMNDDDGPRADLTVSDVLSGNMLCFASTRRLRRRLDEESKRGSKNGVALLLRWQLAYCKFVGWLLQASMDDRCLREDGLSVKAVDAILHFVRLESILRTSADEQRGRSQATPIFAEELFASLVHAAIFAGPEAVSSIKHFLCEYICPYDDLRFYTLKSIKSGLSAWQTSAEEKSSSNDVAHHLVLILSEISSGMGPVGFEVVGENFLDELTDSSDSDDTESGGKKKQRPVRNSASHRKLFEECWLKSLRMGDMSSRTLSVILRALPHSVIPRLGKPHLLLDFLMDCFHLGGTVAVLSLQSLFVMITHHNFDFPKFYEHVYAWLTRDGDRLFHEVHFGTSGDGTDVNLADLLQQLEIFLSSTHLSRYLVAAFVKRLARIALYAPVAAAHGLIVLCYGLLQRHPAVRVLVHRPLGQSVAPPAFVTSAGERGESAEISSLPRVADRDLRRRRLQNREYRAALAIGSGATDTFALGLVAERAAAKKRSLPSEANPVAVVAGDEAGSDDLDSQVLGPVKRHRASRQASGGSLSSEQDVFDNITTDPRLSNAALSSLWEIRALNEHYDSGIARVSRLVLETAFEAKIPVSSALVAAGAIPHTRGSSYAQLLKVELGRKSGASGVPLASAASHRLLGTEFGAVWNPFGI